MAERDEAPLFIVTSRRPQTGKTFLARLIVDYLRLDRADLLVLTSIRRAMPCGNIFHVSQGGPISE